MQSLAPVWWSLGLMGFFGGLIWSGVRLIRWAKRGSKGASLLGWSMGLPAAGVNPIPPPQEKIEELTREVETRKSADAADGDR